MLKLELLVRLKKNYKTIEIGWVEKHPNSALKNITSPIISSILESSLQTSFLSHILASSPSLETLEYH